MWYSETTRPATFSLAASLTRCPDPPRPERRLVSQSPAFPPCSNPPFEVFRVCPGRDTKSRRNLGPCFVQFPRVRTDQDAGYFGEQVRAAGDFPEFSYRSFRFALGGWLVPGVVPGRSEQRRDEETVRVGRRGHG